MHALSPQTAWNQYQLGKKEGVWARQAGEGGCKWQIGGAWALDGRGVLRWGGKEKTADDVPKLEDGVKALGF